MYQDRVDVIVDGNAIVLFSPYRLKDRVKWIPGARWNPRRKAWEYPKTAMTALTIKETLVDQPTLFSPTFLELVEQGEQIERAQEIKEQENLPPIPETRTPPWRHQQTAFWFAHDLPACMLAMDMGTGKSKVVIDLIANRRHMLTLIVCPLSVIPVWLSEFEKHDNQGSVVLTLGSDQSVATRAKQAKEAIARQRSRPLVIVINHEACWREPFDEAALNGNWDLLVVDEAHRAKAPGGVFSMFLARLARKIPYRLALTGTPMPHSPLDIYATYRFLDPGVFGTSFVRFRHRYAVMGGFNNQQVEQWINQEELTRKMYSIAYRVDASVLDLPPVVHLQRFCQLSERGRRIYDQLAKDLVVDIEGGRVTAANALVRLLRLQQITSGYLMPNGENVTRVDENKASLLTDTLQDLEPTEPIVIFCRFHEDLDRAHIAARTLGRRTAELSGRRKELEDWQQPDGPAVLVAQIQAGGLGVDLTRARYCIFYSLGFSLGEFEQAQARTHRPGQRDTVTYVHLVASNSVDEVIYEALAARKNIVEHVLKRLPTMLKVNRLDSARRE